MKTNPNSLKRLRDEQSRCREYLAVNGWDDGAAMGLQDWATEEMLLSGEIMISFATLAKFQALKTRLRKATGSDEEYYTFLRSNGYAKSNQISQEDAAAVLDSLEAALYEPEERAAIREFGGG